MCTALSYVKRNHYFGRNLDLEGSFGEGAITVPENYELGYTCTGKHGGFAMIGTGILRDSFPLFFDACNIRGVCMAGLNFPKNATYLPKTADKINVSPFEIIPFVLSRCATAAEAKELLSLVNAVDIPFSQQLPLTPLHWIVADKDYCFTAEPAPGGLKLYDNPVGVLTNNPPFPAQLENLKKYSDIRPDEPQPDLSPEGILNYGRGMGAVGLPGDWSPKSRFVRAAFVLKNTVSAEGGEVTAFFRALNSVAMPCGSVKLKENVYEETVYSCCFDASAGIYYYTTRANPAIHAVRLDKTSAAPRFYPFSPAADIIFDN